MKTIGAHMSFESVSSLIEGMKYWDLNTTQICTRNMRNMRQRSSIEQELQQLGTTMMSNGFVPLVIHAPYALNPASPDSDTREACRKIVQMDMDMMPNCPVCYVLHPGSSMDGYDMAGMSRLCGVLKTISIPRNVKICVEMMAGQGTQLMYREEHFQYLMEQGIQNVYMTFDSCHVFAAGLYCTNILDKYKDSIKVVHLNGSVHPFRSFKDRHTPAKDNGLLEAIVSKVDDRTPIILETPRDTLDDDVKWLREVVKKQEVI